MSIHYRLQKNGQLVSQSHVGSLLRIGSAANCTIRITDVECDEDALEISQSRGGLQVTARGWLDGLKVSGRVLRPGGTYQHAAGSTLILLFGPYRLELSAGAPDPMWDQAGGQVQSSLEALLGGDEPPPTRNVPPVTPARSDVQIPAFKMPTGRRTAPQTAADDVPALPGEAGEAGDDSGGGASDVQIPALPGAPPAARPVKARKRETTDRGRKDRMIVSNPRGELDDALGDMLPPVPPPPPPPAPSTPPAGSPARAGKSGAAVQSNDAELEDALDADLRELGIRASALRDVPPSVKGMLSDVQIASFGKAKKEAAPAPTPGADEDLDAEAPPLDLEMDVQAELDDVVPVQMESDDAPATGAGAGSSMGDDFLAGALHELGEGLDDDLATPPLPPPPPPPPPPPAMSAPPPMLQKQIAAPEPEYEPEYEPALDQAPVADGWADSPAAPDKLTEAAPETMDSFGSFGDVGGDEGGDEGEGGVDEAGDMDVDVADEFGFGGDDGVDAPAAAGEAAPADDDEPMILRETAMFAGPASEMIAAEAAASVLPSLSASASRGGGIGGPLDTFVALDLEPEPDDEEDEMVADEKSMAYHEDDDDGDSDDMPAGMDIAGEADDESALEDFSYARKSEAADDMAADMDDIEAELEEEEASAFQSSEEESMPAALDAAVDAAAAPVGAFFTEMTKESVVEPADSNMADFGAPPAPAPALSEPLEPAFDEPAPEEPAAAAPMDLPDAAQDADRDHVDAGPVFGGLPPGVGAAAMGAGGGGSTGYASDSVSREIATRRMAAEVAMPENTRAEPAAAAGPSGSAGPAGPAGSAMPVPVPVVVPVPVPIPLSIGNAKPSPPRRSAPAPAAAAAPAPQAAPAAPAPAAPAAPVAPAKPVKPELPAVLHRKATVRYYTQMNPSKNFPVLVVLSKYEVERIVQQHVAQVASKKKFIVRRSNPIVTVVPHFPGCLCVPERREVDVTPESTQLTFWITPQAEGRLTHASIEIWYEGQQLDSVPCPTTVRKQTLARVCSAAALAAPVFFGAFESITHESAQEAAAQSFQQWLPMLAQAAGGFAMLGIYAGASLLLAGGLAWLYARPRKGGLVDSFLSVNTVHREEVPE
ncbi:MAG: hypothetical protein AB7K09_21130 [Planctomycetota bacterium]